ncbi:leucine rich repeat containing protein BspA family protein, partial [Entamoeba invadens IP1]
MVVQLDRYSMLIVSKYFSYIFDYINMVFVCKKFKEIPEMFHFNPISVSFITQKYFPNVETLHLYTEKDKFLSKYRQYYVHYPTPLHKCIKLNQGKRVICPLRTFRFDSQHYGCSYKDANIFLDKAVKNTSAKLTAMDCSNIVKFGLSCFEYNTILVSITLSSNLYEIPDKCFFICTKLKEIDLEHIRVFGDYCFCRCNSLSAITLGTNIIKSAKNAFNEVTSIKNVTAPGVKS